MAMHNIKYACLCSKFIYFVVLNVDGFGRLQNLEEYQTILKSYLCINVKIFGGSQNLEEFKASLNHI